MAYDQKGKLLRELLCIFSGVQMSAQSQERVCHKKEAQEHTLCIKTFCKSLGRPCELSSGSHGSTALHLHAALSSAAATLAVVPRCPVFRFQHAAALRLAAASQHILFMCVQALLHEQ